jgi:hypothetical protein
MDNPIFVKDMNAIRKLGIEALAEKLGPIGMVEFLRQFDSGSGDYTNERHQWLDHLSIEEIGNELLVTSEDASGV